MTRYRNTGSDLRISGTGTGAFIGIVVWYNRIISSGSNLESNSCTPSISPENMLNARDSMFGVSDAPITISWYDVISCNVLSAICPFSVTYGTPPCVTVSSSVPFTYNAIDVLLNRAVRCDHEESGMVE